jgi:2,3-bisphosphoglycerate-dependent phosphoglycerate mutase
MSDVTRLVLVRHGEADCNVGKRFGGPLGCTGLSPEGRRQVERLRDRVARTGELAGTTALYASTLPRAIETAEILNEAIGQPRSRRTSGCASSTPARPTT